MAVEYIAIPDSKCNCFDTEGKFRDALYVLEAAIVVKEPWASITFAEAYESVASKTLEVVPAISIGAVNTTNIAVTVAGLQAIGNTKAHIEVVVPITYFGAANCISTVTTINPYRDVVFHQEFSM